MISVTSKLNNPAREFQGQNGVTFFISLGEKNYDFKTKTNVWTNYDAALFAKDAQIQFYRDSLVEGAVVEVSGTGIIVDASDTNYKPKLVIQNAKAGFISGGQPQQAQQAAPQQQHQQAPQQAPQQGGYQQQAQQQGYQQQPRQQAPQQAPANFDDDTLPF